MTKTEYEAMSFEELLDWAYENTNEITTEGTLKEFATAKIIEDSFALALHILNAIYNNPYDTEWYLYDYNMGTLQTPTPIYRKEDLKHLIDFKDYMVCVGNSRDDLEPYLSADTAEEAVAKAKQLTEKYAFVEAVYMPEYDDNINKIIFSCYNFV